MNRLGFDELPQRNTKFDTRRKSFCKRLALLHTKIASRFKGQSFSWDYRNNFVCVCGKSITSHRCERAFVHREFTWPESYLHHIKYHGIAPPKVFYVMVVRVTAKFIPLNALEKKTVNKFISE